MPVRLCAGGCGLLIPVRAGRTRCLQCTPSSTDRGYDKAWQRLAKAIVASVGECQRCEFRGSAENPLVADHKVAKNQGGSDHPDNIGVLCRVCNGRKGAVEDL